MKRENKLMNDALRRVLGLQVEQEDQKVKKDHPINELFRSMKRKNEQKVNDLINHHKCCLLYTSPSPRD